MVAVAQNATCGTARDPRTTNGAELWPKERCKAAQKQSYLAAVRTLAISTRLASRTAGVSALVADPPEFSYHASVISAAPEPESGWLEELLTRGETTSGAA